MATITVALAQDIILIPIENELLDKHISDDEITNIIVKTTKKQLGISDKVYQR